MAPRTNLIYRSDAFKEKLLAANVTQIAGVVAPDLTLDEELINRWMIAAESADCRFVLFANKADLPEFAELRRRLAPYAALGYADRRALRPNAKRRRLAVARRSSTRCWWASPAWASRR